MKKMISILLALSMLLPLCFPTFAGQEEEGKAELILSSNITIDRDMAGDIMNDLGVSEDVSSIVDSVLAVANAVNDKLTIAENGVGYELFLDDTEVLSFAGGMTDQGLTVLSSMIPDYALTVSGFTIRAAAVIRMLVSDFIHYLRDGEEEEVQEEVAEAATPYIEEFIDEVAHSIRLEEPETGVYDFGEDGSYNTRTQIDIDTRAIVDALNDMLENMSHDEGLLAALEKVSVTAEELTHVSIVAEQLPSVDMALYSNMDESGASADSEKYLSISFFLPKQNDSAVTADLHFYEDCFDAGLNIPGSDEESSISAAIRFVPFDEKTGEGGGALTVDFMGHYFAAVCMVESEKDGSALTVSDELYIQNSVEPLAVAVTSIEKGESELDLSAGERTTVAIESLPSKKGSEVIDDLLLSVRLNASDMLSTAVDTVPELADLLDAAGIGETEAEVG